MKYRVLKDDEVIQKGDVFTGLLHDRAEIKNGFYLGSTVKDGKNRFESPCTFERPIPKKPKYRKLNNDEIIQEGDTIGGDDEHTHIGFMWWNKKASEYNEIPPDKWFVERPVVKSKKLERVTIADVLDIMSDGDGQSPEDLLDDVEDMLRSILERKQSKKPSLEKLIAERDLGMKSIKIMDDWSGRVSSIGGERIFGFGGPERLKSWLLEQPLKKE